MKYEGEVKVQVGDLVSMIASIQVSDLVIDVSKDGKIIIASFRVLQSTKQKDIYQEAGLRFMNIQPTGEETLLDLEQLSSELPPFSISSQFSHLFPFYFLPPERLKGGITWKAKELFFVRPAVETEVNYQVNGKETINDISCRVVTRKLPKPIFIDQQRNVQLFKVDDTLWLDEQTGLIRKMQKKIVINFQDNRPISLSSQLELKNNQTLDEETFTKRLKELEAIKEVQKKLGIKIIEAPSADVLDDAIKAITNFQQQFKDSHYNLHMETWKQLVENVKQKIEARQKQQALLTGLAPNFELTSLEGRKVKLSDFKGKVVLINFFAHW